MRSWGLLPTLCGSRQSHLSPDSVGCCSNLVNGRTFLSVADGKYLSTELLFLIGSVVSSGCAGALWALRSWPVLGPPRKHLKFYFTVYLLLLFLFCVAVSQNHISCLQGMFLLSPVLASQGRVNPVHVCQKQSPAL